MSFRPINDNVLVKRDDNVEKIGSIHVPETAQNKNRHGTVISVGRGRYDDNNRFTPTTLLPGDKVIFGDYSGVECVVDGVPCLIIPEPQIQVVVEP